MFNNIFIKRITLINCESNTTLSTKEMQIKDVIFCSAHLRRCYIGVVNAGIAAVSTKIEILDANPFLIHYVMNPSD